VFEVGASLGHFDSCVVAVGLHDREACQAVRPGTIRDAGGAYGSRQTLPTWLRWLALIAGALGLAWMAWIPHFALLLWSLVAGVWLIAAGRAEAPAGQPQPSS
jgi:hypothetical protein